MRPNQKRTFLVRPTLGRKTANEKKRTRETVQKREEQRDSGAARPGKTAAMSVIPAHGRDHTMGAVGGKTGI